MKKTTTPAAEVPSTPLVTKPKLGDVIKTDATVDMNSIVAYFISKYENDLLAMKKNLSGRISELNNYLSKDFLMLVETEVKINSYKVTVKALGLSTNAGVQIDSNHLIKTKQVSIHIVNNEKSKDCTFNAWKKVTVSDELHKTFTDTIDEIEQCKTELQGVLEKLASISRKEREMRGAVAEKTLRESGFGELFTDQTLLDLVQVPQLSMKAVE